jgi:hypothetical protein
MSTAGDSGAPESRTDLGALVLKLRQARITAYASLGVAAISLIGAAFSSLLTIYSNIEIAQIDDQTKRTLGQIEYENRKSELAIQRANSVASNFAILLTEDAKVDKRVAFLNLWQLYPEPSERGPIVLAGLQYGGQSVFETLLTLAPELKIHKEIIKRLTRTRECRTGDNSQVATDSETAVSFDCQTSENAKELLSAVEPKEAMELLLDTMKHYAVTSPDDPNITSLDNLLDDHDYLVGDLEDYFKENGRPIVITYLLYRNGKKKYFLDALLNENDRQRKSQLVEFISELSLRRIEISDWPAIIDFLQRVLDNIDLPEDRSVQIVTLKALYKAPKEIVETTKLKPSISNRLSDIIADRSATPTARWLSSKILAKIDLNGMINAMRNAVSAEVSLDSEVEADFLDVLNANAMRLGPDSGAPIDASDSSEFTTWKKWLRGLHGSD